MRYTRNVNAGARASLAQLVKHALCKRTVVGSIPTGGYMFFSLRSSSPLAFCHGFLTTETPQGIGALVWCTPDLDESQEPPYLSW